jgi:hypothetical protein
MPHIERAAAESLSLVPDQLAIIQEGFNLRSGTGPAREITRKMRVHPN